MRSGIAAAFIAALGLAAGCSTAPQRAATAPAAAATSGLKVPVEYYKLANGLKVVLSEDHSVPVATVAVYYNIGFRIEPRDRTGFAIGGPPGAVIGGIIGGSVGAAHEPRVYGYDPVYVAPPARARVTTRTYVYPGERYCWRDAWNTYCEYR